MRASTDRPTAARPSELAWLTWRRAFIGLALYFFLQALLRVLVSRSAELDESEQLLWTQSWAWGYGSDPPLYTWLQNLVFAAFGTGVVGLAVLKNALLLGAFTLTYLGAREVCDDEPVAVLAALSLLLFPQITWESQRDLTHSVLASTVAAGTFWCAARLAKGRRAVKYLELGVWVGLGILSKYSYCVLVAALAGAALSTRALRPVVLNRWMILAVTTAGLIVAPHLSWTSVSSDLALQRPEQLVRESGGWHWSSWAAALFSIAKCVVMVGAGVSVVYAAVFRGSVTRRRTLPPEEQIFRQWIGRTFLALLLICLAIVCVSAVQLRDRWFQPLVFLVAIWAALQAKERLSARTARRFLVVVSAIGLLVLLLLPGIPLVAGWSGRPTRLNAPYDRLAAQLRNEVPAPGMIVAGSHLVGGNLRLYFPKSVIVAPEYHVLRAPMNVPWLVIWDKSKDREPDAALLSLVRKMRGVDLARGTPAEIRARCHYTRTKEQSLGYFVIPP